MNAALLDEAALGRVGAADVPGRRRIRAIEVPAQFRDSGMRLSRGVAPPDGCPLVLDTTNAGIWLIDVQARTTFVNRHAAELLGYTEEEMIGMNVFEFMDDLGSPYPADIGGS